ncbi:MAG: 3-oxoacyl-[acyl-carrier-protein] synthase II [Halanaerobium sp. 4-GBenrich]|jgi:3-oxoacyl-[acyl-carrier-protein] synthase II|uniref:3-oxoacyl-[acyl-carrier-protein] synthase 2 n=1 Tax=Halanaerobium congolense TaxID=54121 RepID=A0A1M7MAV6_9FIRM|nr:beta-ketoacyl-ACP synthase II [Halanaerobium congolense]KXS49414.1 MAG: 3-oxoacyl-[acyl-carrier-protein] synthase II [Halanaerobium sp. T82-1]ODS49756.1 MAG: 3-oxoacyl-[acyl-carrier-protein] synthase II [Halanaerobium sp. 4-GBenrich]PUU90007.1 MAG: 3-oxoacyl-acyl-carrier-protein synthase II [Halanaerobium sp.]PTX17524.1 3-oxoacyl-[acyl-carrier-protein] synthase II [Halanaerobium congolense]PXV62019.1 3-oxoacyl-[acyl-carrier-protein] synthase II [Halanaerobium congolense]
MDKRVVITGAGVVHSLGSELNEFWENIKAGKSGISKIENFDASDYPSQIGAELKDFDPGEYIDRKEAKRLALYSQYAIVAAMKAVENSGLEINEENADRAGVMVGSGIGGIEVFEEQVEKLHKRGPRRVSPFFIPMMISNMAAGNVAIYTGAKGPNINPVTACASATTAIGESFETIKRGAADIMIAGGTEASITPSAVAGFGNMKALSGRNDDPEKASRPFDKDRDGFVIGEGAGIVILETLESAKKRGANIIAEVVGYGASGDAYHITSPAPEGEGAVRAMKAAIERAGMKPEEINYINAHGTSTPLNDKYESTAIKKLFGDHAYNLKVSSSKSMTGHLLGAAGGVEAIISAMAVKEDIVPPTINFEEAGEGCDLDYQPNQAGEAKLNAALSNSFGFGGQNACIIVKKYQD